MGQENRTMTCPEAAWIMFAFGGCIGAVIGFLVSVFWILNDDQKILGNGS